MPNWCDNKLLIKADGKESLENFRSLERLFDETLKYNSEDGYVENLLDSIIALPDVLNGTTIEKPYILPDGTTTWWYEWCIDNWGTKWDAVDCYMDLANLNPTSGNRGKHEMKFTFRTAWAPPVSWLEKVASIFPNLWIKLDYVGEGMEYRGVALGRGEIIDEFEEL